MLNKVLKAFLLGSIFFFGVLSISSCQKESLTKAIIIVKDTNGNRINQANVWIYPDASQIPSNLDLLEEMSQDGKTEDDGAKEFEFPYEAILKIEAAKQIGNSYLTGENVVRLLQGKTVTKIIEIN